MYDSIRKCTSPLILLLEVMRSSIGVDQMFCFSKARRGWLRDVGVGFGCLPENRAWKLYFNLTSRSIDHNTTIQYRRDIKVARVNSLTSVLLSAWCRRSRYQHARSISQAHHGLFNINTNTTRCPERGWRKRRRSPHDNGCLSNP